jgi:DNA-binding transcriptional LysR family regulator
MTTIDLNRIAVFVRVVQAGSFTRAAQALGLPVSSVSRAVANLEEELAVRLLHRTTRKLSVTESGRQFFERMQAVIAETEEATLAVSGLAGEPRGLVRVTAPFNPAQRLPQIMAKILQRYPGLTIDLDLTHRRVDLVEEGVDLAIRAGVLQDSSLVARRIADSELGLFAAPSYLERQGRPRRLADLARHSCLEYRGRAGKLPWRFSGPKGDESVAVSGPIVCNDMIFLRNSVLAGVGISLLPIQLMRPAVEAGEAERVLPRHAFDGGGMYLVWHSRRLLPARVVAVRDMLLEELPSMYA